MKKPGGFGIDRFNHEFYYFYQVFFIYTEGLLEGCIGKLPLLN